MTPERLKEIAERASRSQLNPYDLDDLLAHIQALEEANAKLLEAASKLHHWHDWGRNDEGMVVSAEVVHEIWAALSPAPATTEAK